MVRKGRWPWNRSARGECALTELSRAALYDLVWTEPVRTLAERFEVSDVWLRKCCVAANIPTPDRGHWAKLRAGKPVVRTPLPPRAPGQSDHVSVSRPTYGYWANSDPAAVLARPPPQPPVFDEPIETVRARAVRLVGEVVWRRDLKSPHPLIATLLADDEVRRRRDTDAPWRLRRSGPLFDSPFERRRLKVLNSLFLGLARAGATPWINDDEARKVGFVVGDTRVTLSLDYPDAKPDRDGRYATRAGFADVLNLSIAASGQTWADTAEEALEVHLTEVAVQILVAGEARLRSGGTSRPARCAGRWSSG